VPGIGLNAGYSATVLSGGTTYYFRIKNVDEVLGPSDWSSSASATTVPMPTGPVRIGGMGLGISFGL
jgi:hypothetical protein